MEVVRVNISTEVANFWNSLRIYYQQPKSINKQVLFSETIFNAELFPSVFAPDCHILFDKICDKLLEGNNFKVDMQTLEGLHLKILADTDPNKLFSEQKGLYLLVRRLIPKLRTNDRLKFYEFIILDTSLSKAYIFTKSVPVELDGRHLSHMGKEQDPLVILKFNFLQLNWCNKFLEIYYNEHLSQKGINWLKATFIPKFSKLSKTASYDKSSKKLNTLKFDNKVDIVQYYHLYEKMKLKYGKYFLENWTENTDPNKFVYEDIAIATYLIMLWNYGNIPGENVKKQKYIDLGCGNGLLVHILNSEGHLGIGLDIRKRKIWDTYPSSTVLEEQTIIPAKETKYPGADWLIGNHSDELTAWIPIMARLSNDHCQYFVLPCCPYQLNGTKFQRKNAGLSSYQDFINYMKDLSEQCGFRTYIDKLRIPSTKRICLIGLNSPEMSKLQYRALVEGAIRFVEEENQRLRFSKGKVWSDPEDKVSVIVKLRKSVEPVRNCTKMPEGFISNALKTIMSELLKENVICTVTKGGQCCTWNRGGRLPIRELASCLEEQIIKQLKHECKGLQTLLKNQHFLFEVNQGYVQFRKPESMLEICNRILENHNKEKWKTKKCWFFNNHPDKCPLDDNVCSYRHEI